MITFEYIYTPAPITLEDFSTTLKEYGLTGWRFVTVFNGYIFFERRIETRIN